MARLQATYAFHRDLEPFAVFVRREWKAIAFLAGGFCAIMVAGIFLIDPAFFYPRLQTDPVSYWLKAKQLADHGNTAARFAVNLPPFAYAAMPGILRVPALLFFHDFDSQLRAIQLMNVPIIAGMSLMSAYIVSWSQPQRRHAAIIGLSLAFTIISPIWMANVFLPLADAPYAFFTLASIIIARGIVCSHRRLRDQKLAIAILALTFVLSFTIRFTGPAVLAFVAILARGRWSQGHVSRKHIIGGLMATAVFLIVLIAFNAQAIFGRYFFEPLFFVERASKLGMLLNLLSVALPTQIVPSFHLGFQIQPVQEHYLTYFAQTPRDTVWMGIGLLISGVIVAGAWSERDRLFAEIAYVLIPLPVLAVVVPSASRYVMSYQPFLWLFFYYGLVAAGKRFGLARPRWTRNRALVGMLLLVAGAMATGLRMWRVAGTASSRNLAIRASEAPAYIKDVASAFRGLRQFLETLPRDSALVIGVWGSPGRWTAISNINYYHPDARLSAVVRERPVYLLAECGDQEPCQTDWDMFSLYRLMQLNEFGKFTFRSVYSKATPHARVEVFRVQPVR